MIGSKHVGRQVKKRKSRKVHKTGLWRDCWWAPSFSPKLLPIGSILHFEKSSFPYTQYIHITSQKGRLLFISWSLFLDLLLHTPHTVQSDYSSKLLFLILKHPLKTFSSSPKSPDYFLNLASKVHYPIFSLNFTVSYIMASLERIDFYITEPTCCIF